MKKLSTPPDVVMRINLTSFNNTLVRDIDDDNGYVKRYVCIPLEDNDIMEESSMATWVGLSAFKVDENFEHLYTHEIRFESAKARSLQHKYYARKRTLGILTLRYALVTKSRKKIRTKDYV